MKIYLVHLAQADSVRGYALMYDHQNQVLVSFGISEAVLSFQTRMTNIIIVQFASANAATTPPWSARIIATYGHASCSSAMSVIHSFVPDQKAGILTASGRREF